LKIFFKRLNDIAMIPQQMTIHSSGYDVYSANNDTVTIFPGKLSLIPTGIAIAVPEGYEAQIRPRSGLALNHYIGVLNSPGTIDSDYRGEIMVILYNFGEKEFSVEPGIRIAQMVINKVESVVFVETDNLSVTERNEGGFGHTKLN